MQKSANDCILTRQLNPRWKKRIADDTFTHTVCRIRRLFFFLPSLDLLEVEHVAVEVREDVPLEELLLAVEGELLGADGADLPVALHVLLEAALLEVRREDHLAQRAALVDVTPGVKAEAAPGFTTSTGLMVTGWLSPIGSL